MYRSPCSLFLKSFLCRTFIFPSMSHHHHDHDHHPALTQANRKVFIIGIGLNLLFVVAEIIGGIVYNSMALLTDAGHNASDVASLGLSLAAFWMAQRKS